MARAKTEANSGWVHVGDVIVHQSVGVGDVPWLLATCCRSALRAGISESTALRFGSAVGRALVEAFGRGDRPPVLTLVLQGDVCLAAQVAVRATEGWATPVGWWHEWWTPPLVDAFAIRSSRRGTTLRLVVAIRRGAQLDRLRRWSSPNAGHFMRLVLGNIRHFP